MLESFSFGYVFSLILKTEGLPLPVWESEKKIFNTCLNAVLV